MTFTTSHEAPPHAHAAADETRRTTPVSVPIVRGLARIGDFAVTLTMGFATFAVWLATTPYADDADYAAICILAAVLTVNVQHFRAAYEIGALSKAARSIRISVGSWGIATAAVLLLLFYTKTSADFSRGWAATWFGATGLALLGWRVFLAAVVRRWMAQGRLQRHVAIYGAGPLGQRLAAHLAERPQSGVRVIGLFDDEAPAGPHGLYRGDHGALEERVRRDGVDSVLVAAPWSDEERLRSVFARLRTLPVDVRLAPDAIGFDFSRSAISYIGDLPMLHVADKPLSDWRLLVKEVEDKVLASVILLLIAPLLLAIAAAVKLDSPGPVFFRQQRRGFNNRLILVLKFRTMRHDQTDRNAEQLTVKNDPRVTRLGAFLRRTSLDELPQFINVLRGEMSIVGPRPHALSAKAAGVLYDRAVSDYAARHRVKPGITGWAQVNGWRGNTETLEDIRQRVLHDLYYIDNWSLALDLKIIARTVFVGFVGRNAY